MNSKKETSKCSVLNNAVMSCGMSVSFSTFPVLTFSILILFIDSKSLVLKINETH